MPLLTEMVAEYVSALAPLPALSLRMLVPDPGAAKVGYVKLAEIPLGNPVARNATGALKPPLTVTVSVTLPFDPSASAMEFDEATA